MSELEKTILNSFLKRAGKEAKGLELFAVVEEDNWPCDDDGIYYGEVMEHQDNGKVWQVECTRSGKVKDYYPVG